MKREAFRIFDREAILRIQDRVCKTPDELFEGSLFREIVWQALKELERKPLPLLGVLEILKPESPKRRHGNSLPSSPGNKISKAS